MKKILFQFIHCLLFSLFFFHFFIRIILKFCKFIHCDKIMRYSLKFINIWPRKGDKSPHWAYRAPQKRPYSKGLYDKLPGLFLETSPEI